MVGPEISRRLPYFEGLKISYYQGVMMALFTAASVSHNLVHKKPMHSAPLKHIAAALLGIYPGTLIDEFHDRRRNLKVLVIEDYISKHPEDFPCSAPKKYKDILLSWHPTR
ncbi:unnamed protein product [Lymnaea stagnalis]|uniref:Uncharacterized protein n=1 Tax=Lymnaea stagnalis TaxID=6523 RepID=A0AAV2I1B3_LYMST